MEEVNDRLTDEIARRLADVGLLVGPRPAAHAADLVVTAPTADGPVEIVVDLTARLAAPLPKQDPSSRVRMVGRRHVTSEAARRLRASGSPYVDSGGNMWLDLPGFRVEIDGRSPTIDAAPPTRTSRAFRPGGLKLIFVLLCWPERRSDPLRELARLSGVSLGAAQGAVHDLESEGYLHSGTDGVRRLVETDRLVQRWLALYPTRLLPKLDSLALAGPDPSWWMDRVGARTDDLVLLSGEAALAELHSSLRPLTTTLWGRPPWGAARQHARLRRDEVPNTFLRERFWDESLDDVRQATVPALLIYADAVATGEPRQLEVAEDFWRADADLRRLALR